MHRTGLKVWLAQHKHWIYLLLGLPLAGGILYQVVHYYIYPLPYLSWPRFHAVFLPLAELFLLLAGLDLWEHTPRQSQKERAWQFACLVAGLNLVLALGLQHYYAVLNPYPGVLIIRSLLPLAIGFCVAVVLISLVMGFGRLVRKAWVSFSFDAPAVEVRGWKWVNVTVLLTCFLVGIGLRLINLDQFPPYVDEYIHTHDAIAILSGEPLEWGRAYLTVSLPVFLSLKVFGISLWASRLPMVLINMLAVFPLYALTRKINPLVGMISVVLFTLSPWGLAVARTVRDYAVIPLYFYIAALLLVDLLDWEGLGIRKYLRQHWLRIILAGAVLAYALYDKTSTLKVVVALYAIFSLVVFLKVWKNHPSRRVRIVLSSLGAVTLVAFILYSGLIRRFQVTGMLVYKVAGTYWDSLVAGNLRQWYMIGEVGFIILIVVIFLMARALFKPASKTNLVSLFFMLAFATLLVYLTFFLVNPHVPERVRYGILMEYWYIPVVAIVLFCAYRLILLVTQKALRLGLILVTVLAFINVPAIYKVLTYPGGGSFPVTGEKHYVVQPAYDFLVQNSTAEDVLVSDVLHRYDELAGGRMPMQEQISYFSLIFGQEATPVDIIKTHPQGWLALTLNARAEEHGIPMMDFESGGKQITYLGELGEVYLWHWDDLSESPDE
jgi:hypothetical protein